MDVFLFIADEKKLKILHQNSPTLAQLLFTGMKLSNLNHEPT